MPPSDDHNDLRSSKRRLDHGGNVMRRFSRWFLTAAAIAIVPAATAFGQNYPFYYGHNYGTHYVKDKNHDYWHDYSPDRDHYFGDPGYERYDDPDMTNDAQQDSQAHFKGFDYDDDGFGYRYRPTRPLPQGRLKYQTPDPTDVYGVGPDLFEPDYVLGRPVDEVRVARPLPRIRADRSMDKYGRYYQR
jgi:hypothetical protein